MRKQRQGFMKCWNSTHHTVSQKKEEKKITAMLNEKMKNSRMLWKRYRKCSLPEGKKSPCSLGCMKKQKKYEEEDGSGGEETTFPLTAKHCSSLIRFLLLPMSKCFHGSLWARHVVSALKSLCYSRPSNLPQNLLLRKRLTYA